MKLLIVLIIIFINASTMNAKSVKNKVGENIFRGLQLLAKKDGLKIHSMKMILMKYVESKFPHLESHQQTRLLKKLVHKIKGKIISEILKEKLRSPWLAKEDMLARMLK